MRSSTSNSDAGANWRNVWLLVIISSVVIVAAWELTLRASGLKAEYSDNRSLWLSSRQQLAQSDTSVIALLGASRIQRAVEVATLEQATGRPVVQLAVEGSSGLPVLENLAVDPRFRGTVVLSIAPAFSFNRKLSKLEDGDQAKWVRAFVDQSQSRRIEQELRLMLQGLLVFRSTDATVPRAMNSLLQYGDLPEADFKTTYRNRFVSIDPEKFEGQQDQQAIVELYNENAEAYEEKGFEELLHYFSAVVDIHNQKGSHVIILRLPSEGKVLDFERQNFPKSRFWNVMKNRIDATFVHFDDYPQLNGFLSNDGSHIDSNKAVEFTEQLALVLSENSL